MNVSPDKWICSIYIIIALSVYSGVLWTRTPLSWREAGGCEPHEWKELIPRMRVNLSMTHQTQWLCSNLVVFVAKIRLLLSANGEHNLDRSVPLSACQQHIPVVVARQPILCPIRTCAERPRKTEACVNVFEFRSRLLERSAYIPFQNISATLTYWHIDRFGSCTSCAWAMVYGTFTIFNNGFKICQPGLWKLNAQVMKLPMLWDSKFLTLVWRKCSRCQMFHRIGYRIISLNFDNYRTDNQNNWTYEHISSRIYQVKWKHEKKKNNERN